MKKAKHANTTSLQRATRMWSPLFLGPVVIAFVIGFVWPFLQGIWLSLCQFKTISNAKFVGLSNYAKAFSDVGFRTPSGTPLCSPSYRWCSSTCWPSPWPTP